MRYKQLFVQINEKSMTYGSNSLILIDQISTMALIDIFGVSFSGL